MREALKYPGTLLFLMLIIFPKAGCMGQQFIIQNVSLISMENERLMLDQDVIVDNGIVVRVGNKYGSSCKREED